MCKEKINSAKLYSRSNRPRILIDMDDCITACLRAVVKAYNEENGTNFKTANCDAWDLTSVFGCDINSLFKIFRTPGFFENLEPKKGAIGALRELIKSERYDLYILTATSDLTGDEYKEKIAWIKEYLPEFNTKRLIACSDKEIVRGDVIIDDKVENLDKCAPFMQCILMDSPTNRDCDKYIRLDRMKNLPSLLDEIFYNSDKGIKHFQKEVEPAIIEAQNDPDTKITSLVEEVRKVHYSRKIAEPKAQE